jgi:hypothetical protein
MAEVERLADHKQKPQQSDEMWLRRQGANLIAYLPEAPADAISVLHYAEVFYRECVMKDLDETKRSSEKV